MPVGDERSLGPPHQRRWRKSWIAVGLILTLVLPPIALWFLFIEGGINIGRPLTVRAATPADFAPSVSLGDWTDPAARPIAVAEGTVTKKTYVEARLYVVRDGVVAENNRASTFRRATRRGGPRWYIRRIVFALAEAERPHGRVSGVAVRGLSSGRMGGSEISHHIEAKYRQTFTGAIGEEGVRLLYVEGDREFVARRDMTIEEFAQTNDGNFLAVAVGAAGSKGAARGPGNHALGSGRALRA